MATVGSTATVEKIRRLADLKLNELRDALAEVCAVRVLVVSK